MDEDRRIGTFSQLFPPKPTWTAENVPNQTGRTVIVTGGNSGIGRELTKALLSKGAKVYIASRSKEKSEKAIEELKRETGKESLFYIQLDLSDLVSVQTAAEEFIAKETALHTLYNNAGVYGVIDRLTAQGFDMQFGTNVLGHYHFTKLLLPLLTATATNAPPKSVRVVTLSSLGHYVTPPEGIRWNSLSPGGDYLAMAKRIGALKLYGQSKLGNILISNEFARQYGGDGIVFISLHPGTIQTDLGRHMSSFQQTLGRMVTQPVSHGAITPLFAGTDSEAGELNGKYLTVWARPTLPHKKALDTNLGKTLWKWCEDQINDM